MISSARLLGSIVDELPNIVYTKLVRVESFSGPHTGFCSGLYPTRIMKDKAWATRVCYLVVDHAHPTLDILLVGWENKWRCLLTRRTSSPPLTSVGSFYIHQLDYRCEIYGGALTTQRPSLSRISGKAPSSLPVIFSRMVVFPAFRRPMISTRNRLHNRLRSLDERSMLARSTKQRSWKWGWAGLGGNVKCWRDWVGGSTFNVRNKVWTRSNLIISAKYLSKVSLQRRTWGLVNRHADSGPYSNGALSKPFTCRLIALALPGLPWLVWVKMRQRSFKRNLHRGVSWWALYCWSLVASLRAVSDRKETIWRGTYRWLSPFPRLVQTEPRLHPWTACHQIRSPRIQPCPWSQIARPNPHLLLTIGSSVAADCRYV